MDEMQARMWAFEQAEAFRLPEDSDNTLRTRLIAADAIAKWVINGSLDHFEMEAADVDPA